MFVTIIATWTAWLQHHCKHLWLSKCCNSGRIWGEVWGEVDVKWGSVSKNWSRLSPWWIVQQCVLIYRLRAAKQQQFWVLCPLGEQHSQLSLKHFPVFFAESFCQECFGFVTLSSFHTVWRPSWHSVTSQSPGCYWFWVGPPCSSMSAVENCQSFTLLSSISGSFKVAACFHNEIVFHVTGSDVFATCGTSSPLCCFSSSLSEPPCNFTVVLVHPCFRVSCCMCSLPLTAVLSDSAGNFLLY